MIESPVSDLTSIPNSLPVNALDVIIRFWGKLIAPALAATLEDWLGVPLDAEHVLRDRPAFSHHVTTPSAGASIATCCHKRSRMLFLDAKASVEAAPLVAQLMATLLHKDEVWIRQQVDAYNLLAKNYLPTDKSTNV